MEQRTLGQEIRHLRTKANRTLRQFAGELGISAPYLSDIELGRRQVPEKLLEKIAKNLAASLDELKKLDTRIDPELREWMQRTPATTQLLRRVKESMDSGAPIQKVMKDIERALKKGEEGKE